MDFEFTLEPIAECSTLVCFNSTPSPALSLHIAQVSKAIHDELGTLVMNVTPSYHTILVDYLPHRVNVFEFHARLESVIKHTQVDLDTSLAPVIELPVYYDIDVGPDIPLYQAKGISIEDLIEAHTSVSYTVSAVGFAPGFAFLTSVAESLQLPRKSSPRLRVPKGSVAIADNQTAVYPNLSPGGWNIIGNCPIDLYDPNNSPMTPFEIGAQVQFRSISKQEFTSLGGVISSEVFNELS
ncbi:5-oxoprolinase subunit B family protein [Vibrio paucivorans]|uniref:Allophanate hydrolase subunit 1 n=1 Tax=Vibrio paucivorans TaxID=2829489 RepID=A0A9X3CGB7_9VIBR|nr:allophanate hydrolase subunit 1 [Vibrio paucivorans]MCW8334934.1 allophanate hydrolase subunit 1 [Vibrio paucivorans]